jgi:hypothetical protein
LCLRRRRTGAARLEDERFDVGCTEGAQLVTFGVAWELL